MTRDYVLALLTCFFYTFGFFALIPTLPIYLTGLGSNEREVGVLVGIFNISSLASRLLAGAALSKYPEKRVMIFAALLFAVAFLACIFLRPFWPFLAVRLLQGVAYACFDTAVFALIVKVTPPAHLGRAIGYLTLAPAVSMVLASSFGMSFVNRFGFALLFLFCAGTSLCSLCFSITLKGAEPAGPNAAALNGGALFFERKIVVPGMSAFFYYFVLGAVMAFFPLYAIECGVRNPGYFFSASAFMTIAGRALGGRLQDAWGKEKIMLTFIFISMAAMVILSFSGTLPMFIFVGLLWGTVVSFILPVSMAYSIEHAGVSGGTAVGTFRALTDLGFAIGPMVTGLILPLTGYRAMFLCLALICLANLCYFQFYVRKRTSSLR